MSIFGFLHRVTANYAVALSEPYQTNRGWAYVFARDEYVELRVFQNEQEAPNHYLATKSALSLGSFISIRQIPVERAKNMKFDDIRHLST